MEVVDLPSGPTRERRDRNSRSTTRHGGGRGPDSSSSDSESSSEESYHPSVSSDESTASSLGREEARAGAAAARGRATAVHIIACGRIHAGGIKNADYRHARWHVRETRSFCGLVDTRNPPLLTGSHGPLLSYQTYRLARDREVTTRREYSRVKRTRNTYASVSVHSIRWKGPDTHPYLPRALRHTGG